jgi:hypothetical protein
MLGRAVKIIKKTDRGKGQLQDYMPHDQVGDVPSQGASRRVLGWKTGREHHTLSTHESRYFYICEWSRNVIDIREQYPLPLTATLAIAQQLGIRHPYARGQNQIMATDFLVTALIEGRSVEFARYIKPAAALEDDRALEKAEIERMFHASEKRDWGIVTEHEIPAILADNIKFIHGYFRHEQLTPTTHETIQRVHTYLKPAIENEDRPFHRITSRCDSRYGLTKGESLKIAYHLIATRKLRVDMTVPLDTAQRLTLLSREFME